MQKLLCQAGRLFRRTRCPAMRRSFSRGEQHRNRYPVMPKILIHTTDGYQTSVPSSNASGQNTKAPVPKMG